MPRSNLLRALDRSYPVYAARDVYVSDEVRCFLVADVLVYVALHTGDPSNETLEGYLEAARGLVGELAGMLIVAGASSLSAKQRDSIRRAFGAVAFRSAVLTDSIFAKGVLTTLRWFGIPITGFSMGKYHEALSWVGHPHLTDIVRARVEQLLAESSPRLDAAIG
jgi:hypothetical protein